MNFNDIALVVAGGIGAIALTHLIGNNKVEKDEHSDSIYTCGCYHTTKSPVAHMRDQVQHPVIKPEDTSYRWNTFPVPEWNSQPTGNVYF